MNQIRVLVVDDSIMMRQAVRRILERDVGIVVVDTARDGLDALLKVERLQPDVVTMDVEMPKLDGLAALGLLMERFPRPVVMFSSLTAAGTEATVKALSLGAVDSLCKPNGQNTLGISAIADELIVKVKGAARARVRKTRPSAPTPATPAVRPTPPPLIRSSLTEPEPDRLLVIGSSTGGPRALADLMASLPGDLPCPVLIVQHLPAGFTRSLADRLDQYSPLAIAEAKDGDTLAAGRVLVAPGNFHLRVQGQRVALESGPRRHGVRPAVDTTLETAAATFGPSVLAVILTGMGDDGTEGCRAVKAAGGLVVAEAESTCVVYGMPRSVVEAGLTDEIAPLDAIPAAIARHLKNLRSTMLQRLSHAR